MKVSSHMSVLKIVENEENSLSNVSEDPDVRNATLDTGRSLKQILIGLSLFLVFLTNRKN